jgi:hypothetical protein
MQGRSEFTPDEITELRRLIREKQTADRERQRALRGRMRRIGFYAPQALGLSDDFFREHIAGELRWVRRGRKKLVAVTELQRWLDENAARLFGEAA